MMWRKFFFCLCLSSIALQGGCTWLGDKQREIIYRPTPQAEIPKNIRDSWPPGAEEFFTTVAHGSIEVGTPQKLDIWWWPQLKTIGKPDAPALLYLHGTFRPLSGNNPKIRALYDAGFSVMAVDYRGWGRSTYIVPSQQSITQDAISAWDVFLSKTSLAKERFVFGHSMGGAVAVALASHLATKNEAMSKRCPIQGLILESTFSSMPDVARHQGAFAGLLGKMGTERFDSRALIPQLSIPLLMMHGQADRTIDISLGKRLFDAAKEPKTWVAFELGTHSQLHSEYAMQYREHVQKFLSQTRLQATCVEK